MTWWDDGTEGDGDPLEGALVNPSQEAPSPTWWGADPVDPKAVDDLQTADATESSPTAAATAAATTPATWWGADEPSPGAARASATVAPPANRGADDDVATELPGGQAARTDARALVRRAYLSLTASALALGCGIAACVNFARAG